MAPVFVSYQAFSPVTKYDIIQFVFFAVFPGTPTHPVVTNAIYRRSRVEVKRKY